MSDLTPAEQAKAEEMLADLRKHGYADRERFNELAPGVRVRHSGHRWPEAYTEGTGVVVAITERNPSAWSQSWGSPDIEMVVAFDKPPFPDMSRLSQLAQYHVQVVRGASWRPVITMGHVVDVVARELTEDRADTVTAVLRAFGYRVELVTDGLGTLNIWAQPTDTIGEVRIITAVKAVTDMPLAWHEVVAS